MKVVFAAVLSSALFFSAAAMAQPPMDGHDPQDPHAAEVHHDYQRGHRAPARFLGNSRMVSDYQRYHLHRPPHGYHWVRGDDNDFLLVAVTTGIVSDIVAGEH